MLLPSDAEGAVGACRAPASLVVPVRPLLFVARRRRRPSRSPPIRWLLGLGFGGSSHSCSSCEEFIRSGSETDSSNGRSGLPSSCARKLPQHGDFA